MVEKTVKAPNAWNYIQAWKTNIQHKITQLIKHSGDAFFWLISGIYFLGVVSTFHLLGANSMPSTLDDGSLNNVLSK